MSDRRVEVVSFVVVSPHELDLHSPRLPRADVLGLKMLNPPLSDETSAVRCLTAFGTCSFWNLLVAIFLLRLCLLNPRGEEINKNLLDNKESRFSTRTLCCTVLQDICCSMQRFPRELILLSLCYLFFSFTLNAERLKHGGLVLGNVHGK